jgi:hypothetical protein
MRRGPVSLPQGDWGRGHEAAVSGQQRLASPSSSKRLAAAAAATAASLSGADEFDPDEDGPDGAADRAAGAASRRISDRQLRARFTYALAELQSLGLARVSRRRGVGGASGDAIERCVFEAVW